MSGDDFGMSNEIEAINEGWPEEEEVQEEQTEETSKDSSKEENTDDSEIDDSENESEQQEKSDDDDDSKKSEEDNEEESNDEDTDEDESEKDDSDEDEEDKSDEEFTPPSDLLELIPLEEGQEIKSQEDLNAHISTQIKTLKEKDAKFTDVTSKLNKVFSNNPELAIVIEQIGKGKSFIEAAIASGLTDLLPEDGDFDFDEYQEKIKEHQKANQNKAQQSKVIEANVAESQERINAFMEKEKLGDDYYDTVVSSITEFAQGNVSEKYMSVIQKGLAYDQKIIDLEKARKKEVEAAKIAGRNEKIVKQKHHKANDTDIPSFNSKSNNKKKAPKMSESDKEMMKINETLNW